MTTGLEEGLAVQGNGHEAPKGGIIAELVERIEILAERRGLLLHVRTSRGSASLRQPC